MVDISSHSSKLDDSIISESDTEVGGGENMGGVPNFILRCILPD